MPLCRVTLTMLFKRTHCYGLEIIGLTPLREACENAVLGAWSCTREPLLPFTCVWDHRQRRARARQRRDGFLARAHYAQHQHSAIPEFHPSTPRESSDTPSMFTGRQPPTEDPRTITPPVTHSRRRAPSRRLRPCPRARADPRLIPHANLSLPRQTRTAAYD